MAPDATPLGLERAALVPPNGHKESDGTLMVQKADLVVIVDKVWG